MRRSIVSESCVVAILSFAFGTVCAQQAPTPDRAPQPNPPTQPPSGSIYPLPNAASQIPSDPGVLSPCQSGPCLQTYVPPAPEPPTQFNWNNACGSLSTEGSLINLVPGGQELGVPLNAAGALCKIVSAGAAGGAAAATIQTVKEGTSAIVEGTVSAISGSEGLGTGAGMITDKILDSEPEPESTPGSSSQASSPTPTPQPGPAPQGESQQTSANLSQPLDSNSAAAGEDEIDLQIANSVAPANSSAYGDLGGTTRPQTAPRGSTSNYIAQNRNILTPATPATAGKPALAFSGQYSTVKCSSPTNASTPYCQYECDKPGAVASASCARLVQQLEEVTSGGH